MPARIAFSNWRAGFLFGLGIAVGAAANWIHPPLHGAEEPATLARVAKQERTLVQQVFKARDDYQASLEQLHGYYKRNKNEENRYWVQQELTQFHMMVRDPYLMDMDLPSPDLKPERNTPEANKILRDALEHLNRPTFTEREKNHHRAELLLRRLLRDYPQSDKLDDACYYLGEIYSSRYFKQYRRAVAFYERVFHYDPNTNLDARLRAAQVYDRNLGDRRRAIELYQEVLAKHIEPSQTKEARRRLDTLLSSKTPTR